MRPAFLSLAAISNEPGQFFELCLAEIDERRADWPSRTVDRGHTCLSDRACITLSPVSNRNIRKHELSQPGIDLFVVAAPHGRIELLCKVGKKVEDCGGVCRHPYLQIGKREGFGRRQASDISQPVAQAGKDASHQLDIAHSVFEADKVLAALA